MDDDDRLAAWRSGDRKAGNALFQRFYPLLQRFFMNKVDSQQALEDLIQNTFLVCVDSKDRIPGTAFRPYLFGIARNLLRQHWARRRTRVESIDELSLADLGASPTTALGRDDQQRVILAALRRVSLADQELLEAYYWEGLDGKQLAELFGTNERTLRTRMRTAKQAFAKEWRRLQNLPIPLPDTKTNLEGWAHSLRSLRFSGIQPTVASKPKDEEPKDEEPKDEE